MRAASLSIGVALVLGAFGCATTPASSSVGSAQPAEPARAATADKPATAPAPGASIGTAQVTEAPPTLAELPTYPTLQRRLAARIGVETYERDLKLRYVPFYGEPELTPEQQKVLDEENAKKPVDDLLNFYNPPRGVQHGASPLDDGLRLGVDRFAGQGARSWGRAAAIGTWGWNGIQIGTELARRGAARSTDGRTGARPYLGTGALIGESEKRTGAVRHPLNEQ